MSPAARRAKPETMADSFDRVVSRALDLFDRETGLVKRGDGPAKQ